MHACIFFFSNLVGAYTSFFELIAGFVTFFMGVVLLTGLKLPQLPIPFKVPRQEGLVGSLNFGVLYGLASISCSAPIFLSILVNAISSRAYAAVVIFVVYALGMGLPLVLVTVFLAKVKETIHRKAAELTSAVQKLAGLILLLVGSYLIIYFVI